jgi:hypothetical protein
MSAGVGPWAMCLHVLLDHETQPRQLCDVSWAPEWAAAATLTLSGVWQIPLADDPAASVVAGWW